MAYSSNRTELRKRRLEKRKQKRKELMKKRKDRMARRGKRKTMAPSPPTKTAPQPSSLSEKAGRSFADIGIKLRTTGKKLNFPGLFARALTPEKTERAWDTGRQQSESTAGKAIQYFGSEIGSNKIRGFGKGYAEGTYMGAERRGLVATGNESKWEKLVMAAPTTAGGFASAAAVGAITKNSKLMIATQALYTGAMEAGSKYDEALREGATKDQAKMAARITGGINAAIEVAPGLRWARKILPKPIRKEAEDTIKKTVLSRVIKFGTERLKDAGTEGATEAVQEVVGNMASKYTYDPDKDWKENVGEAGELGAYMGLVMGGLASGMGALGQVGKPIGEEPTAPVTPVTPQEADVKTKEAVSELIKKTEEKTAEVAEMKKVIEKSKEKEAIPQETTQPLEGKTSIKLDAKKTMPAKKISPELEPLAQKAIKYKSNNEFLNSLSQPDIEKIVGRKETSIKPISVIEKNYAVETFYDQAVKSIAVEKTPDTVSISQPSKGELKLRETKKQLGQEKRDLLKGAKQEQEYAYKFARKEITEQFKTKIKDISKIREDIIKYAEENLPNYIRGTLLKRVTRAKSQNDLEKAFADIDEIATGAKKVGLKKQIKKTVKKINKAKNVSVDYVRKVNDIIETIDLTKRAGKTTEKLKATREWIAKESKAGKDVYLPKKIYDALKILEAKTYESLTVQDMEVINDKIQELYNSGVTKERNRSQLYQYRKENTKKRLLEGTHAINKKEKIERGIGEKDLGVGKKIKNIGTKLRQKAQHADVAITPVNVMIDKLDGNAEYTGANYMNIRKPLDHDFNNFLNTKWKFEDVLNGLIKSLNLNEQNMERIMVYAVSKQKNGTEKLIATDDTLTEEKIANWKLTDAEMKYYTTVRKIFDEIHTPFKKFMKDVYNQDIGTVDNYTPFMQDFDAMSEFEKSEMFHPDNDKADFKFREGIKEKRTKEVKRGTKYSKKRKGGKQKIITNFDAVTRKYISGVTYLMNTGENIKMFSEIVNTPEYQEKAGTVGGTWMKDWLDTMARMGGVDGERQIKLLDAFRKNVGAAVLAFKLSSVLIQPTALLDGAVVIGNYAFRGAEKVTTDKKWREFLVKNFGEVRERQGDDSAWTELAENKTLAKWQQAGFFLLQYGDKTTAGAVVAGAYMKYMKEHNMEIDLNNPNKDAVQYAQGVMQRTQSSALFKDLPLALSKGALTGNISIDKALLQFQLFIIGRAQGVYRHEFYRLQLKKGKYGMAVGSLMYMIMAQLMEYGLRDLGKSAINLVTGHEEDENEKSFIQRIVMQTLSTFPFVSNAMSMAFYQRAGFPVADVLTEMFVQPVRVATVKTPDARMRALIRMVEAGMATLGVGGAIQASDVVEKTVVPAMQPKKGIPVKGLKNKNLFGKKKNESIVDKVKNLID